MIRPAMQCSQSARIAITASAIAAVPVERECGGSNALRPAADTRHRRRAGKHTAGVSEHIGSARKPLA